MPPIGRRPGKTDTREVLLATARRRFAATGYERTSVREIAAEAGVDPGLIRHYFGSKAELFRAAMGWPFEPAEIAARITDGPPELLGERLTRAFFEIWDHPDTRAPLLAILRGAATHDESAALVRQFIQGRVYSEIASALPVSDAELRIDLAMAHLVGVAYLRYVLRVEPVASEPRDSLVARIGPAVSLHLGDAPSTDGPA
ncbi:TetR/AcrR family transcriptional regulator [Nocardia sp. CC227C]|uniref:TetR/AcrR family transcriptional regulator n=1 Tax=Nocardia sp. CC227C TaxID=3044562 RepID=UPI00278BD3FF|nr:TetR family transcriptional regulator [Nocardia sp. CC227C]